MGVLGEMWCEALCRWSWYAGIARAGALEEEDTGAKEEIGEEEQETVVKVEMLIGCRRWVLFSDLIMGIVDSEHISGRTE